MNKKNTDNLETLRTLKMFAETLVSSIETMEKTLVANQASPRYMEAEIDSVNNLVKIVAKFAHRLQR